MSRYSTSRADAFGNPDRPLPRTDRKINARHFPCPSCDAAIGEPCKSGYQHQTRRRLAVRAAWDAGEFAPAQSFIPSANAIRFARVGANLSTAELGAICGTTGRAVNHWEGGDSRPSGRAADLLAAWFAEVTK